MVTDLPTRKDVLTLAKDEDLLEFTVEGKWFTGRMTLKELVRVQANCTAQDEDEFSPFLERLGGYLCSVRPACDRRKIIAGLAQLVDDGVSYLADLRNIGTTAKQLFGYAPGFKNAICRQIVAEIVKAPPAWSSMPPQVSFITKGGDRLMRTESAQKSPSDFAKDNIMPEGVGYIVTNEFDPSPNQCVTKALLPPDEMADDENDDDDVNLNDMEIAFRSLSFTRGLVPLKEEESIQPRYNSAASRFGARSQSSSIKYSILGSKSPATSKGKMDGGFTMFSLLESSDEWALGVWENKGSEASTFSGLRQAGVAYGFGIATFLLGLGIPYQDIVVPIVVYTGIAIQFGAVFVLDPSFPVFTVISDVLDLSRGEGAQKAARHVAMCRRHVKETERRVQENWVKSPVPDDGLSAIHICLDKRKYFLKEVSQIAAAGDSKNWQAFGETVEVGSYHMMRVLNHLSKNLETSFVNRVCFPRGYREGDRTAPLSMIFDNMSSEELEGGPFCVGLPDRNEEGGVDLWNKWLMSVEETLAAIHKVGVVHVDPYPSNVLWRLRDGNCDIMIIDWDAMLKIVHQRQSLGWKMTEEVDTAWDVQYLKVMRSLHGQDPNTELHQSICRDLASNDVSKINAAFRTAAETYDISGVDLPGYI